MRVEQARDDRLGSLQSPVEKNGAAERLEGVGEDRLTPKASALELTRPELQHRPDAEPERDLGQRLAADETRPQTAQIALGCVREGCVQTMRNDEIEDRVAEELEPFVVRAGGAAMGECSAEQSQVARLVAELLTHEGAGPVSTRHSGLMSR